jgi:uncharacterized protein YgbK (DUF1537 family)
VNLTFASIADDDTGACDIAGMLASQGMRTIVVLDSASPQQLQQWTRETDALVLAIASRALPPQEAYRRTREASELIRQLKPRSVGVKYCSTFDSTPQGNIGPSIDAAMDVLEQSFTVAVPAFPVNGRTTYLGHHFVGNQLLSESPMRNHPLNPMTNSNLVSHLQSQTRRRVGLAAHPSVRGGVLSLTKELKTLRDNGVEVAIVDCICDTDLEIISAAIADMPLITGSSGYATMLPSAWKRLGYWSEVQQSYPITRGDTGNGTLVISGSCSEATRTQSRYFDDTGAHSYVMDGMELASESFDRTKLVAEVVALLKSGEDVFIRTNAGYEHVHAVQQWALAKGSDQVNVGLKISMALGAVAFDILQHTLPQGLIVAGGETSGTVCRMLGMKALRVGRNIVPGVPLCASITAPMMPVILKSGNFGGEDFFIRASDAVRCCPDAEGQPGNYVC